MQDSAFIVAYRYILLQKQYKVFSDFCLNQHFIEVVAFCMPSTDPSICLSRSCPHN